MIPKTQHMGRPLGRELPSFCQLAWKLVSIGEAGTRQQVITKLATEGGLLRIKELTMTPFEEISDEQQIALLNKSVLPFFQTVSHTDVLSSLVLESAVDTIYNFLFGPSGRRAVRLFTFVSKILPYLTYESDKMDQFGIVEASLAVLQKIIDLNGTALIIEEFKPIVESISEPLGEEGASVESLSRQRARRHLSRIQRRLGFGDKMASAQIVSKHDTGALAIYEVGQDMPGSMSAEGPRHDNDHEDITNIKIMPTTQEIQSQRSEYLPVRDPAALHIPGLRGLLDRHFRLLREDTVGQLRDAVGLEIERLRCSSKHIKSSKQSARTIVYNHVNLPQLQLDKWKGLQVVAEFDQPSALQQMSKSQRQDWWEHSKQLQMGSLLCLVDSEGNTLFLSVAERSTKALPGKESNQIPGGSSPQDTRDLFTNTNRASVVLTLVDTDTLDIRQTIEHSTRSRHTQRYLIEFPGVLIPSFRPTLQALQQMSQDGELPFAEFLAPSQRTQSGAHIQLPAYARQEGFSFDLSSVCTNNERLMFSPGSKFDLATLQQDSTLDEAQASALVEALSRSLALIQGPPGTGKSFTGIALIKVLLDNRKKADLGPIICVCYTNHALDQLLEHLVLDGIKNLVRLGSRSKSEVLEPLNLVHLSRNQDKTKQEKHSEWVLRSALDLSGSEIERLLSEIARAGSETSIKTYLSRYRPWHHRQLFGRDDDGFQTVLHGKGKIINSWIHQGASVNQDHVRPVEILDEISLNNLNRKERQKLHQHWIATLTNTLCEKLDRSLREHMKVNGELNRCRQELNLRCLQEAHVIGVTTTGLARNIDVLRRLRSKVMICEEAGEVLEAHTITALLPRIEHSILIGDHQQLRPQIQNYELQHESRHGEKYSLDVSLFERLVDPKGSWNIHVPFSVLEVQRRMHPAIAQLVRNTLYPTLQDHPDVGEYPEVPGFRKRLFWLDHQEFEVGSDPTDLMATSHSNNFEVEMTAAVVSHLIRQGEFQTDEIAIITPYLGQFQRLRRRMSQSYEILVSDQDAIDLEKGGFETDEANLQKPPTARKTTLSKALRIATVDNFQGEEAKVVVVSLVRSNRLNKCGFLRTSNRINVLLSRARHGMYIIGNAQTSSHVPMWGEVLTILKDGGNIGRSLPLRCSRHPETLIEVATPDDFSRLVPEGGCNEKCILRLFCGHACLNKCHSEPLHNAVVCLEPCPRSKAGCDHACPLPCGQECQKVCHVKVANVPLLCGHVQANLECYKAQDLAIVRCQELVDREVPGCKHQIRVDCHQDVQAETFECRARCGEALPCGHHCLQQCKNCNEREDNEIVRRSHAACRSRCDRPYNSCAHRCTRPCHGEEPCPLCEAPCEIRCAHSKCDKRCQEPCAPCAQDCSWSCPHQGRCQMPCAVPCDTLPCSERCREMLECGHQCPSICGENCPSPRYCQICASEDVKAIMVDYIMQGTYSDTDLDEDPLIVPSCGHIMTLSNMDGHMGMSAHYELSEDSSVRTVKPMPNPFSEDNLKTCPMCRGPLRNINRYNRIVRQGLLEQATRKFLSWANQQYIPLEERLFAEEKRLQQSVESKEALVPPTAVESMAGTPVGVRAIHLDKSAPSQLDTLRKLSGLKARYRSTILLKVEIVKFYKQVHEAEQPFGRVHDMIQDIRRRRSISTDLTIDQSVLNTRNRMLATVLAIRCDLAIVFDFISIRRVDQKGSAGHAWIKADLELDFSKNRRTCRDLITEARSRDQPMHEVEGRVFFARWTTLERSAPASDPENAKELLTEATEQLDLAEKTCKVHPSQTRGMLAEISNAYKALHDGVFYSTVDNEERRQVYAVMAAQFTGTGHWYTCVNGHPFTVGECGMPMETSVCPQCGARIGGQSHRPAAGVVHDRDFEARFAGLRVG